MSSTGLPPDWIVKHSKSKNALYYFHGPTRTSQWSPPEGTDKALLSEHVASLTQKVRAAHLLVKHRDSRRASSWKSPEITRSHEEATEIIRGFEKRIRNGETTLSRLAETESDCSSAKRGGDLKFFGRGEMQKEFEEVAFSLQPGEISGPVDTGSGVHLIERLE